MKYSDATEQSESNEEAANSATLELECAWFELVLKIALSPYVSENDEPTLQNPYAERIFCGWSLLPAMNPFSAGPWQSPVNI